VKARPWAATAPVQLAHLFEIRAALESEAFALVAVSGRAESAFLK